MDPLETARRYHAAGLSVFSRPYGEKGGAERWGHWQYRRPTEEELHKMFGNGSVNTALAFGPASGNLLGLDADNAQRYAEGLAFLAGLGIDTWIVRRPPSDGRFADHNRGGLFVFRAQQRATGRNLRGMDVKCLGYSLVPVSRHPDGVDYYTEAGSPESIFELPSLDILKPWIELRPWEPLPPLTELEAQLPPRGKIPRKALRILAGDSETIGKYDTKSEAEFACLCSLVNAGYDLEACKALFLSNPVAGKFHGKRPRKAHEAFAWLQRSYRKAADFVLRNPAAARKLARRLEAWAGSRPWPGRTGQYNRAVYHAHLAIVQKCGHQPYAASSRELAVGAGVSRQTAAKATQRLQDAGLIELVQEATFNLSATYCLLEIPEECANLATLSLPHVGEWLTTHIDHDAFRWSGLNKSGAEVFAHLRMKEPSTVKELAEATGRSATTVDRKLQIMAQLGMAEQLSDEAWRAISDVDLDEMARRLGTAGAAEAQKREHRLQRERHQRALDRGWREGSSDAQDGPQSGDSHKV